MENEMAMNVSVASARRRSQRGSAMVELALTFLGFLLLLFGIMDFSWAVYIQTFCYAEAQDAVRWASVRGSESNSPAQGTDVQTFVQSQAVGLSASSLTVKTCWLNSDGSSCDTPSGFNTPGSNVQVTISYPVSPLSYIGLVQGFTVSATGNTVINN
jgi:Flp pilus assembly protein TadG